MDWDDFRYILAVSRAQSLSAAARDLGVSQPTVSRRVAAMEKRYGVRLFDRLEQGYALTPAGDEILESLERVEEELTNIDRQVFGRDSQLTGSLRITSTEVLANHYLSPHFSAFVQQHPEIDISLLCGFQQLSLSRREADVAIRITSGPSETLSGRHLVNVATAVYVSVGNSALQTDDINVHDMDWIGWQDEPYNRAVIQKMYPKVHIRHRVDDMHVMASMARSGLGVVILPCYFADTDPGLRRAVTEPILQKEFGLWILTHPDVRRAARVRTFTAFMAEAIMADRDLFEGTRPQP